MVRQRVVLVRGRLLAVVTWGIQRVASPSFQVSGVDAIIAPVSWSCGLCLEVRHGAWQVIGTEETASVIITKLLSCFPGVQRSCLGVRALPGPAGVSVSATRAYQGALGHPQPFLELPALGASG